MKIDRKHSAIRLTATETKILETEPQKAAPFATPVSTPAADKLRAEYKRAGTALSKTTGRSVTVLSNEGEMVDFVGLVYWD
jgi:hypothetical protein